MPGCGAGLGASGPVRGEPFRPCGDLDERVAVRHAAAPVGERVVGEALATAAVGVLAAPPPERDRATPGRTRGPIRTGARAPAAVVEHDARRHRRRGRASPRRPGRARRTARPRPGRAWAGGSSSVLRKRLWCFGVISCSGKRACRAASPWGPSRGATNVGSAGWPIAREPFADELDLARRRREHAAAQRPAVVGVRHPQPPVARAARRGRPSAERVGAGASRRRRTAPARSKPIAPASRRNSSVLLHASPSGAIAASFQPIQRWPHAGTTSVGLELRRGRQHDVGVAGGVGEELLVHDGEQVVARRGPARISSALGTMTSGLQFHTTSAVAPAGRASGR